MSSKKVGLTEFGSALAQELEGYVEELQDDIPTIIEKEAKTCVNNIKSYGISAGIPNGAYLKGWKTQLDERNRFGTYYTVYNPKHYRLAHLLEHGHAIVTHGKKLDKKTDPKPHLSYAEETSIKNLEASIKRRIEQG